MKHIFTLFIIALTFSLSYAQKPCFKSASFFQGGSSGANDKGFQLASDQGGNILVAGYTQDTAIFNGDTIPFNSGTLSSYLAKIDPNGNLLWLSSPEQLSIPQHDYLKTVVVDDVGNAFTAGYFNTDTLLLNGDTIVLPTENSILLKYGHNGNLMWYKAFNSNYNNEIYKLFYYDQHIYCTGYFKTQLVIDTITLTGSNKEAWFAKFDLMGNVIWAKNFTCQSNYTGYQIGIDNGGNIILTGKNYNQLILDQDTLNAVGSYDEFIAKFDNNGNYLWAKPFSDPLNGIDIYNVDFDGGNNIYIAAKFSDSLIIDNDTTIIANENQDALFVKLDSMGQFLWLKSYSYGGSDYGYDLNIDDSTIYFLIKMGQFSSSKDQMLLKKLSLDGFEYDDWTFGGRSGGQGNVMIAYDMIKNNNGRFFVCGDYSAADAVFNGDTIINQFGAYNYQMAIAYFDDFSINSPIITCDSQLCKGDSLPLMAIDTNSLSWSDGLGDSSHVIIAPLTDSSYYYVTGTSYKGCEATDSVMIAYYVQDTPQIILNVDTLSSSIIGAIYQWQLNEADISGATNSFYIPSQSGSYKLLIVDSNSCSITSASFDYIATHTYKYNISNDIILYPNPMVKESVIRFNNEEHLIFNLEVYDILGNTVKRIQNITTNRVVLERNDMTSGIYFIELKSTTHALKGKFLVE